jgi:hypothetical protein
MTSQEYGDHDTDEPDRSSGIVSTIGDLRDEPERLTFELESNRCTFGQTRVASVSEEMDPSFFDFEFTEGMFENEYDIDEERILIEGPAENYGHIFGAHRQMRLASFRRIPGVVPGPEPGGAVFPAGQGQPADAGRGLNHFDRVVAGPHSLLRNLQRLQPNENDAVAAENQNRRRESEPSFSSAIDNLDEYWVTERGVYRTEEDEQREITRGPSPDNDQLSGEFSAFSTPRMTTEAPSVCTTFQDQTFRDSLTSSIKGLASARNSNRDWYKDSSCGKEGSGGSKRPSNRSTCKEVRGSTTRSLAQVEPHDDFVMDLTMPVCPPAGRRRACLVRHLAHRHNVPAAAAEQLMQPQQDNLRDRSRSRTNTAAEQLSQPQQQT